ncbi:hypothetical protein [Tengunoibacter tsumagoiensis]|uniref:Uncharacterized protein n=1 Tax=Tengunoibacter tsumagoiensis TaxID=2014871 RepID=A0A402A1K8_9CHLR|nr:hypothetical protein [Tengunoibacter tsumagoiensis]GCE12891.1 hypothetical protein KTT_27500 [Tengunoibacter tsumagoiensis]
MISMTRSFKPVLDSIEQAPEMEAIELTEGELEQVGGAWGGGCGCGSNNYYYYDNYGSYHRHHHRHHHFHSHHHFHHHRH